MKGIAQAGAKSNSTVRNDLERQRIEVVHNNLHTTDGSNKEPSAMWPGQG